MITAKYERGSQQVINVLLIQENGEIDLAT